MKTALIHIHRTDAIHCVPPVQTQHFASQRYNIFSHDCTDVARNISTNLSNQTYRTGAIHCVSPVQTQHFASQRYNIASHDCTDVARNISTNLPNIANNRAMARFFNHQTYKQPQTTLNIEH